VNAFLSRAACLAVLQFFLSGCAAWNYLMGRREYPMPDGSLPGKVICGQPICKAGQNGKRIDFIRNPWSPSVDSATTPMEAASQVIGYTTNNSYGRDPFTCSKSGVSPFSSADVKNLGFSNGRSITYSKSELVDIDVAAAVQSDLNALVKGGLIPTGTNMADLQAKLSTAYSSLDQSKVTVTARYFEFGLGGEAYRDVFEREKYPECVAVLKGGRESLITGAGMVWFDLEFESSSLRELISKVQGDLDSLGIRFSLGASIRKNVNEKLNAVTKNGFQVITWTTADAEHFRNP
jgi:hypothetical protein